MKKEPPVAVLFMQLSRKWQWRTLQFGKKGLISTRHKWERAYFLLNFEKWELESQKVHKFLEDLRYCGLPTRNDVDLTTNTSCTTATKVLLNSNTHWMQMTQDHSDAGYNRSRQQSWTSTVRAPTNPICLKSSVSMQHVLQNSKNQCEQDHCTSNSQSDSPLPHVHCKVHQLWICQCSGTSTHPKA